MTFQEEIEHMELIDSLTIEQEEKLHLAFARSVFQPPLDDDMSDAFEGWLESLPLEE